MTRPPSELLLMAELQYLVPSKEAPVYYASEGGKELLAFVDIGINPNVMIPPGSGVLTFVADGMVSVGIGNNVWAGGNNNVTFGLTCHITGSTLEIDGRTLVAGGELQL